MSKLKEVAAGESLTELFIVITFCLKITIDNSATNLSSLVNASYTNNINQEQVNKHKQKPISEAQKLLIEKATKDF